VVKADEDHQFYLEKQGQWALVEEVDFFPFNNYQPDGKVCQHLRAVRGNLKVAEEDVNRGVDTAASRW